MLLQGERFYIKRTFNGIMWWILVFNVGYTELLVIKPIQKTNRFWYEKKKLMKIAKFGKVHFIKLRMDKT